MKYQANLISKKFRNYLQSEKYRVNWSPVATDMPTLAVWLTDWDGYVATWFASLLGCAVRSLHSHQVLLLINDLPYFPTDHATWRRRQSMLEFALEPLFDQLPVERLSDFSSESSRLAADKELKNLARNAVELDTRRDIGYGCLAQDQAATYRKNATRNLVKILASLQQRLSQTPSIQTLLLPGGVLRGVSGIRAICHRHDVRTPTYDSGGGTTRFFISSRDPACQCHEVKRAALQLHPLPKENQQYVNQVAESYWRFFSAGRHYASSVAFQQASDTGNPVYDIVMPLSQEQDTATLGLAGLFATQVEWIQETLDWLLDKNPGIKIAIRQHPHERNRASSPFSEAAIAIARQQQAKTSAVTVFTCEDNTNTYQLISAARCVVTFGSTTALEAAMLGTPTVTVQDVYYANSPFCILPADRQTYHQTLLSFVEHPQRLTEEQQNAARLFYYLRNHCCRLELPVTSHPDVFSDWLDGDPDALWSMEKLKRIARCIGNGENICLLEHEWHLINDIKCETDEDHEN